MKFIVYIILSCVITNLILSQNSNQNFFHPYSNKIIISSEVGFTHLYSDFDYSKPQFLGRGSIEYFFSSKSLTAFGLRILGGVSSLSANSRIVDEIAVDSEFQTDLFFLGAGFSFARKWGYSVINFGATISHIRINPKDGNGNLLPNNLIRKYDQNHMKYSLESSIRFIITDHWSINLGISYNITNTDYIDDVKINENNDNFIYSFIGFSLFHGGDIDSDNDGITDNKDLCPDTPNNIKVDSYGCPPDSDNDDVPDYMDECTNTPRNVLVTEFGCPTDSDGDGIPDYLDRCPNTLAQMKVDSLGCPILDKIKDEETSGIQPITEINSTENTDSLIQKIDLDTESGYNFAAEKMLKDLFFTDGRLYCFQVGSFKKIEEAEREVSKYKEEGHNAFIIKADPFGNNEIWFRVRIGYFGSLQEAKDYKIQMDIK